MMLRFTSVVPPAMVSEREPSRLVAQPPLERVHAEDVDGGVGQRLVGEATTPA